MEIYQDTLRQAGLTTAQATVYGALLVHGSQKAGSVAKKTGLKRGLIYKALEELVTLGMVERSEKDGAVASFRALHPSKLRDIIESEAKKLKDAELVFEGILPSLISEFNLISGTPGIQIYEGAQGIEKVLADSLTSKTEVYTYADIEPIVKRIGAINQRYATKRDQLGIDKKAILLDTPFARKYMRDYHRLVTDIKLIALDQIPPFQSALEIYDNKVAYITFAEDKMMGVIIHDPYLYQMHKYLFEYTWKQAVLYECEGSSASFVKPVRGSHKPAETRGVVLPSKSSVIDGEEEYYVKL